MKYAILIVTLLLGYSNTVSAEQSMESAYTGSIENMKSQVFSNAETGTTDFSEAEIAEFIALESQEIADTQAGFILTSLILDEETPELLMFMGIMEIALYGVLLANAIT